MQAMSIFLCVYSGDSTLTTYPVQSPISPLEAHLSLKQVYIAGLWDNTGKILASLVLLSDAENSDDPLMVQAVSNLFQTYKQTQMLFPLAVSAPVSRIKFHPENGSIEQALSYENLEFLCSSFYLDHSISGRA
ncbi:negative control protein of sporulation [Rouxiella sp. Mn2063]|uniref:negative control protein of sporulation n=1 Tax=Rouxiella sp. Mn2063 TaxID=3395262 RepID=UPI003BCB1340